MFKVVIQNIQAIKSAEMVFEDNTITEFVGDNSNGKSILAKVVQYLTSGDIMHKDVREALINDDSQNGIILMQHNKKQLALCISQETRDSYVIYCPDADKPTQVVKRYLNEKGIDLILEKFGFRIYDKGGICLQIAPTFGGIPFITTSGASNYDIVEDIKRDKVAEEFLETFRTITFPLIKTQVKTLEMRVEEKRNALSLVDKYDWAAYGKLAKEMQRVYGAIKEYIPYTPEHITLAKCKPIEPVPPYTPKHIPLSRLAPVKAEYGNIKQLLTELRKIKEGVCPTCGKPLIDRK